MYLGTTHDVPAMGMWFKEKDDSNMLFTIDLRGRSASHSIKAGDGIFFRTPSKTMLDADPISELVLARWPEMGLWQRFRIMKEGEKDWSDGSTTRCREGYSLHKNVKKDDITNEPIEEYVCLAKYGTPVYIGDKIHLVSHSGKYLTFTNKPTDEQRSLHPKMRDASPGEATRLVIDMPGLPPLDIPRYLKYDENWAFDKEIPYTGEVGHCDLKPIQSVLSRIPKEGVRCRNKVIDFHCKDLGAGTRLRMHKMAPINADGGGTCPHDIHDPQTGSVKPTYNVKNPPEIPSGNVKALMAFIISQP